METANHNNTPFPDGIPVLVTSTMATIVDNQKMPRFFVVFTRGPELGIQGTEGTFSRDIVFVDVDIVASLEELSQLNGL